MPTNLNTLKARVRKEVEDNELKSGDQIPNGMEEMPETLKHIAENNRESLFLKERFITSIAEMMQKHEEWVERTLQGLKCKSCDHIHNPTDICHVA